MLSNGTLILTSGTAHLNAQGTGNVLDSEIVTNTSAGIIDVSGVLTLDSTTAISNGIDPVPANNGTVTVESTGTLTLEDTSSIDGGIVTDNGIINLAGTSVLSNGTLINSGQLNVSGTGNSLDNETVNNTAAGDIDVSGGLLTLITTAISNGIDPAAQRTSRSTAPAR